MQNAALKKNISCLFKTAQLEVQRKDAVIQSLRDKIVAMESSSRHHNAWHRREDLPGQETQPFSCNDVEEETEEHACSKENLKGAVSTRQDPPKHVINDASSKYVTNLESLRGPVRHRNDLLGPAKDNGRQPPHMGSLHSASEGEARKRSSELLDTQDRIYKYGDDKRKHDQTQMLGYPESKKHCNRENSDPANQRGHCSGYNDNTARNGRGQDMYHMSKDHSQTHHTTKHSRPFKNSLDGYCQYQNKSGSG
eukprot:Em0023g469a